MDDSTPQMLRNSGRRLRSSRLLPPQTQREAGPLRETRDPTRSPPDRPCLRFCLGCQISYHASTMPPDSLHLWAQKMQTSLMKCLGEFRSRFGSSHLLPGLSAPRGLTCLFCGIVSHASTSLFFYVFLRFVPMTHPQTHDDAADKSLPAPPLPAGSSKCGSSDGSASEIEGMGHNGWPKSILTSAPWSNALGVINNRFSELEQTVDLLASRVLAIETGAGSASRISGSPAGSWPLALQSDHSF